MVNYVLDNLRQTLAHCSFAMGSVPYSVQALLLWPIYILTTHLFGKLFRSNFPASSRQSDCQCSCRMGTWDLCLTNSNIMQRIYKFSLLVAIVVLLVIFIVHLHFTDLQLEKHCVDHHEVQSLYKKCLHKTHRIDVIYYSKQTIWVFSIVLDRKNIKMSCWFLIDIIVVGLLVKPFYEHI